MAACLRPMTEGVVHNAVNPVHDAHNVQPEQPRVPQTVVACLWLKTRLCGRCSPGCSRWDVALSVDAP